MTFRNFAPVLALVAVAFPAPAAVGADDRTAEVLAQVRKALGGEQMEKVTTLAASGTYRRLFGEREMSGDLELAMALPDKFLRTETINVDPTTPIKRFSGFNAGNPLDSTSGGPANMMFRGPGGGPGGGAGAGPGGTPPSPEEMQARRLRAAHRDFGRLLVAMLVGSSTAFPLQYEYGGEAESDDGKADVLNVTGPEEFAAKLFIDQQTHLPLMILFKDAMPRMQMLRGGQGGERPSREEMERRMQEARAAGPPPQVDVQLFLSDHRKVDGVLLPHTIRRAVDGKTQEELQVTYKVNPAFKPEKFEKK